MSNCTVCGKNWSRRVPIREAYTFEIKNRFPKGQHYKACIGKESIYFHLIDD